MIDKSLNEAIDSDDEDYVMRKIREDYLSDSTVTIHLIGQYGAENRGEKEQRFIKRELQASLYNGKGNTRNGILGVVLPEMTKTIYGNSYICNQCGYIHDDVRINDDTTIKEFSSNYYIQNATNTKCSWSEYERYCVLVKWNDFIRSPKSYIELAFKKRNTKTTNQVTVYP